MRLVPLLLLPIAVCPPPLPAQEAPQPGQRVRITHECRTRTPVTRQVTTLCRRQAGRLVEVREDSITLAVGNGAARYRMGDLVRLELSRGRRSRWLAGGLAGSAIGGVAAFAVLNGGGSTSLCNQSQNQDAVGFGECVGIAALFGLVPGFGLGALVGAVARSERWEEVPVGRLRLSVAPDAAAQFRLVASVAF